MFTTPDPVNLPLPSPHLIALHAACAKVAHLSGAGEYIDHIHENMEEISVLAHDGTSSEVREGVTNPTPKAEDLERRRRKRNRTKGGWRTTRIPFRL
jgi:hypothetical protein